MSKPLFQKVDCVRLYVPDLDAGLAFYRDRLGHELIWRTGKQAGLRLPGDVTEMQSTGHSRTHSRQRMQAPEAGSS